MARNSALLTPFRDFVVDSMKNVTKPWTDFFNDIVARLSPLGKEMNVIIENNVSSAKNVDDLVFNSDRVSQAVVEFIIQRVTDGFPGSEVIESGCYVFTYQPIAKTWIKKIVFDGSPADSGVDLSIVTSGKTGQVQYTSSNIAGTFVVSKISFRVRTLAAKSSAFSTAGVS